MFTVHTQKRLFTNFRSKKLTPPFAQTTSISGIFPLSDDVQHIFDVFLQKFHWTLWPWPSTFRPCRCQMNYASYIQRTYYFLAFSDYPFQSYGWLNMITLPSHGTVNAHAPCHVTYHRGQKWFTFLKSRTHFVTSMALRRWVSNVVDAKWSFPIVKTTKFNAHVQYHVTCA